MNEFEKIKSHFHEILFKNNLFEMARSREKAIRELNHLAVPYITHVCKIMLWGNQSEQWLKDWSDEIFNYLEQITSITLKNNKRLKEKDYLNEFFYICCEADWELQNKLKSNINAYTKKDKYPEPSFVVNPKELFSKYLKFIESVIPQVVSGDLEYDQIILSCRILIGG